MDGFWNAESGKQRGMAGMFRPAWRRSSGVFVRRFCFRRLRRWVVDLKTCWCGEELLAVVRTQQGLGSVVFRFNRGWREGNDHGR